MNSILLTVVLFAALFLGSACTRKLESTDPPVAETAPTKAVPGKIGKEIKAIEPFFKLRGEPEPMGWLATYKEGGQTFEEYFSGNPTLPTDERKTIYVQPLGKFTGEREKIVGVTAEYMQAFFGLPVELLPGKNFEEPLSIENYRVHPDWKTKQIRTGYILDELLLPNLPADAAALIAFTAEDLYPSETMNFVFGQASLQNRVGVWSLNRMKEGNASRAWFFMRTLKIAVHETGHMFSIAHCTKYICVMSGTNGNFESDKHPLDACPECAAKITWGMKYSAATRYKKLAEFCERNSLASNAKTFREKLKAVQDIN